MSKRSLLGLALVATLLGGVACDDDAAPGDPTALGGHWVGEAAAIFSPSGLAVTITTDDGEVRMISYLDDDVDTAGRGPLLPPPGFQIVANLSADGEPSESLLDFLDEEIGVGEGLDVLTTGLSGNLKFYMPEDYFDTSRPAGEPPIEEGPPVFPTGVLICSSAGAGEGICDYDAAIGEGQVLAGVVETTDFADASAEEPGEPDIIGYNIGEYEGETYEVSSSLDKLTGYWLSMTGPVGLQVAADGSIDGDEDGSCLYGGSFSIIDATVNVYRMSLIVTSCGDWDGTYTGLATVLDPAVIGEDEPDATPGDVLMFQVDNGQYSITNVMVADEPIPD